MFEKLGPALRFLRKRAGLTQRELANKAGVGRTTILNFENGATAPSLARLSRLLESLNADLADLHEAIQLTGGGSEEEPGPPPQEGMVVGGRQLSAEEFDRRLDAAFDRFIERTQASKGAAAARKRGVDGG